MLFSVFFSMVQGGVDSRTLFHTYIMVWVQDMELNLLDLCKAEKVLLLFHVYLPIWIKWHPFTVHVRVRGHVCLTFFSHPSPGPAQISIIDQRYCSNKDVEELIVYSKLMMQVPWSGVMTNHSISPFAEEMYEKIRDALSQYEVVINRWPQYSLILESVSFNFVPTVTI